MGLSNIFRKGHDTVTVSPTPFTGAVIVAAGCGSRMGGTINKQLIDIAGEPVIVRCINAFERAETVREIVVVTSDELIPTISDFVSRASFQKVRHVTAGGDTRQQSVSRGLDVLSAKCRYAAIHDGARPFVSSTLIDAVNRAAYGNAGAAAGINVNDTVKTVTDDRITGTVDRSALRLIQTPQTFDIVRYRAAQQAAILEKRDYTDDCQLLESIGERIILVPGMPENIKITTPFDVTLAQLIAQRLCGEDGQ